MLPFVDVPLWLAGAFSRLLRSHRVDYRVRVAHIRRADSEDPDDHTDRFTFPTERPDRIQVLVDAIKPPGCR